MSALRAGMVKAGWGTRCGLTLAALAALTLSSAAAESTGPSDPAPDPGSTWIVSLGATGGVEPRYLGSRLSAPTGTPSVGFRRVGEPDDFSPHEDGLDYTLYGTKTFQIGPVASLRGDRNAGADARLNGLKKYPMTIDAGVFANLWPIEDLLRVRLEVRQGLRPDDGVVADLNGDLVRHIGAFTLSGGPRLSFGDAAANKLELGVSPLESARNGAVPAFKPHAGARTLGYGAALSYDWSPTWRTTMFHRFDRLVGDAAESPITKRLGSADQATLGVGFVYSFAANTDTGQLAALH